MLKELLPTRYQHYYSLPVLGNTIDWLLKFLTTQGYSRKTIRAYLHAIAAIDHHLQQLKCHSIDKSTLAALHTCSTISTHSRTNISATKKLLERYFKEQGIFLPLERPSPFEEKIIEYRYYLQKVRGLAPATVRYYSLIASQFLNRFSNCGGLSCLSKLMPKDIEDFVRDVGSKVGRRTLHNVIASLRSFLRFFSARGEISTRLDSQIDTPRVYREEQLPRALDWETVCALLQSVDRSTAIGKRDYAMLLLISTYGLRASEIVSLKLEDIEWRANQLQIFQHKTSTQLLLPLTDAVGESIIEYLREGRPSVPCREIFVRHVGPNGTLKSTTVTSAFNAWSRRSGLSIPFQGPHCLRHSYAIHLLRQGTSLKTIGDVLGHKSFKSTCVYLRLNIEDLRTVPLCIPILSSITQGEKS